MQRTTVDIYALSSSILALVLSSYLSYKDHLCNPVIKQMASAHVPVHHYHGLTKCIIVGGETTTTTDVFDVPVFDVQYSCRCEPLTVSKAIC